MGRNASCRAALVRLAGRVALITGGSSGIGEAIARRFASEGARVAVAASSDIGKAERVAASIRDHGGTAWACAVDVRLKDDVAACIGKIEEALGVISILVNSAGVYYPTPVGSTSQADLDRMVDINLKGTFTAIDSVAPGMIQRRYGKIVNIASVAAVFGVRGFSLYCATKAAVAQMTVAMARELGPFDVNCNAIAPGNVITPMNEVFRAAPQFSDELALVKAMTPSTTAFSAPDDIAALAVFLASDDARALHRSVVVADEGISTGVG